MSHEIRTPMNGVIGMIELVSHSKMDEQQKDFISTAKRSAESLMIIINDILDFSKIEAGELTIERVEFDLEQIFTELIHDQRFMANKKGLKLELEKQYIQQTQVVGDPHRITQVLNNLLTNAIKFTKAGSIIVQYGLNMNDDHLRLLPFSLADAITSRMRASDSSMLQLVFFRLKVSETAVNTEIS